MFTVEGWTLLAEASMPYLRWSCLPTTTQCRLTVTARQSLHYREAVKESIVPAKYHLLLYIHTVQA